MVRVRFMFDSNYNICIVSLATESMGLVKWRTYSKVAHLCKPGKIDVHHGLTYFCLVSDVTLIPLKNSKLRPSIILILTTLNFHKIQNLGKKNCFNV